MLRKVQRGAWWGGGVPGAEAPFLWRGASSPRGSRNLSLKVREAPLTASGSAAEEKVEGLSSRISRPERPHTTGSCQVQTFLFLFSKKVLVQKFWTLWTFFFFFFVF